MQHVKLHVNLLACWFENLLMYLWVYPTSNSWKLPEACLCTILAICGRALKLGWSPERLSNLPDLFLYSNKKNESSLQTATSDECDAKSEKMRHLQLCRWVTTPRWCSSGTVLGALQPIWYTFSQCKHWTLAALNGVKFGILAPKITMCIEAEPKEAVSVVISYILHLQRCLLDH